MSWGRKPEQLEGTAKPLPPQVEKPAPVVATPPAPTSKRYFDRKGRLLINQRGLEIVQHFESCRLQAYPDPASPLARACVKARISYYGLQYKRLPGWEQLSGNPWTLGWGRIRYPNGAPVREGDTCTQAEADVGLIYDLEDDAGQYIYSMTEQEENLTDDQFSALVSFTYNRGCGRYDQKLDDLVDAGLADKVLTAEEAKRITDCLLTYNWAGSQGNYYEGLDRRRHAEVLLFLGLDWRPLKDVRTWKKQYRAVIEGRL